ncbi:MAG TPA: ATP-binding cassette domain-containing protein [Noviherbaspirillum sp.]
MSLVLNGVSVRHPSAGSRTSALHDISLAVSPGEQLALIGPSGAGKTTLLHTLACALRPHDGEFKLFDADPWQLSESARHALRRRLFLAPQTPPLPPRQRVVTAVLAGMLPQWNLWRAFASLLKPADPQRAYDALARFNLEGKLYDRVDRLSGGERQRCSMARLLVSQAGLFLVDEPLSALDPTLAERTLGVLQQEAKARNAMLVCSLHQVELARAYFPRIVGLRDGRIVFDAPREHVTDDMIAALYRDARDTNHQDGDAGQGDMSAPIPLARCF